MYEIISFVSLAALFVSTNVCAARAQSTMDGAGVLTGTVRDSASGAPLRGASVRVSRGTVVVATVTTALDGRYIERGLAAGTYAVTATRIGYRPASRSVDVPTTGDVDLTLAPGATHLAPVNVTAGAPVAIDLRNGDQTFQQQAWHGSPTTTTSQIVQQAIAGAARAPTGEVHIRGQQPQNGELGS